jgi:hypothetical protein
LVSYSYYGYFGNLENRAGDGALVASTVAGGFTVTESLSAGAWIDGQLNFPTLYGGVPHALVYSPGGGGYGTGGPYGGLAGGYLVISDFPEGVAGYMAVRFSDIDGYHYGWIGVVRNFNSMDFDAFAWGYETDPGVGIVAGIPAPGTLAALAFGVAAVGRGRKRKGT